MRTVAVPNMVIQSDTVGGHVTVRITDVAEKKGAVILLTDVDIAGTVVEGHRVYYGV